VLNEGSGDDSGSLGRGVGSMGSDLAEAGRRCRIRIVAQFFEMGERRNRSTGLAGGSTDETEGMEMRREPLGGLACGTGHGDAADLRAQHQTAHSCASLTTLTGRVHCFLHSPSAPCPIT
jgi:hypothetical protein